MLSRFIVIVLLGVSLRHAFCDDIVEEEGVLVLSKSNFESAITNNEYILVEFYAPWCGHCKALAPEYASAAATLKEKHPNIKLAKVDATEETDLAEEHSIKGYPTLKFFVNSKPIHYTGGRKSNEIVQWLLKKTGPPAKVLNSVEEVNSFKEENTVVVVGYFASPKSDAAKSYLAVALSVDDYEFGIVEDQSVAENFGAKDTDKIILYKKFDENEVTFKGETTEDNIKRFVSTYSLPLVVDFNQETANKVFSGEVKSHLLVFFSKAAGHFDKYIDVIKPVAKKFRDQVLFISFDADIPDHKRIIEYFGIQESEVPAIRMMKLEEEMIKYKPEKSDITEENIGEFVQAYVDGKLKEHLLSQELPSDWNTGPVTILVVSNFDEIVFDKEKDVLVEFYAPWCSHCKQLSPIYDQLGTSFKSNDKVVIAKIDATANELEHTKVSSFPTIKLFAKGDNQVYEYKGERTFEGLKKFVETGGQYGQDGPPVQEAYEEADDVPQKDEL